MSLAVAADELAIRCKQHRSVEQIVALTLDTAADDVTAQAHGEVREHLHGTPKAGLGARRRGVSVGGRTGEAEGRENDTPVLGPRGLETCDESIGAEDCRTSRSHDKTLSRTA